MNELELYKFITNNNIEWHDQINDGVNDVLIFINNYKLQEFQKLIESYIDEEPMLVYLKSNYLCVWMKDLCEYYGIDMDKIFIK